MFCRAMDSRRSVMEGRDETEKKPQKNGKLNFNINTVVFFCLMMENNAF